MTNQQRFNSVCLQALKDEAVHNDRIVSRLLRRHKRLEVEIEEAERRATISDDRLSAAIQAYGGSWFDGRNGDQVTMADNIRGWEIDKANTINQPQDIGIHLSNNRKHA